MNKNTTMMTNNVFRSIRPFREGSSNIVLFSLQHGTLRSNMTIIPQWWQAGTNLDTSKTFG